MSDACPGAGIFRGANLDINDTVLRQAVLFRLDAVALGVLVAKYRRFLDAAWLPRAGIALITVAVATIMGFRGHSDEMINATPAVKLLWLPCMQFGVAACIPAAESLQVGAFWQRPAMYSYSVYLFHQPMRYIVEIAAPIYGLTWLIWAAGTFVVAGLVYHFYEAPMTRMRDQPSLWSRLAPSPVPADAGRGR